MNKEEAWKRVKSRDKKNELNIVDYQMFSLGWDMAKEKL